MRTKKVDERQLIGYTEAGFIFDMLSACSLSGEYLELHLALRRAVIMEMTGYGQSTDLDGADLLSNVLLAMEKVFQEKE